MEREGKDLCPFSNPCLSPFYQSSTNEGDTALYAQTVYCQLCSGKRATLLIYDVYLVASEACRRKLTRREFVI